MATHAIETEGRSADWSPAAHDVDGSAGGGALSAERLEEYDRLRESCPVAWAGDWGGYWTMTRYADVRDAATKHGTFRSGQLFVQIPQPEPVIPLSLNPPEHAPYRRALNKYLAPDRMARLEPIVRDQITECFDPILARGSAEMISEFCAPVPALGLASLLNMSPESGQELIETQRAVEGVSSEDTTGMKSFEILAAHVAHLVAERRADPLDPDEDLISGVMAMEIEGRPLSDEIVMGIGIMIIGAGHGTTRDGLASSLHLLATHPGDQARLRRDPSLIPSAIEEFLRLEPPVQDAGRCAGHDVELHGRSIAAGEHVAMNLAAANRDEREFEHPHACMIDRAPNRHLSFGHGVHKCLGAPLGRLELRVALEEILGRTRSFELSGAPEQAPGLYLGGYARLPLRFTAR